MKKLLLTSILIATVFMALGGMDAFEKMKDIDMVSDKNVNIKTTAVQVAKYDDCITENHFPEGYLLYTHEITNQDSDWDIIKVNESVQKYGKSLDSTIKNLSTVDAHAFIHQTFNEAKRALATDSISDIKKHYHGEIMRLCYTKDKTLNQNTVGLL